jgi:hypothetical protein
MWLHFYNPGFFFALLFLAGILVIHLLKKSKTVSIRFSTLRFFTKDSVQRTETRKLRKLLLLITRLLLVSFIIAMFAQPHISSKSVNNLQNPNASVFVWVDHSPSMEYIEKSIANGQRAVDLTDSIAARLPYTAKVLNYNYEAEDFIEISNGSDQFRSVHGDLRLERVFTAMKSHKRYSSYPVLVIMSDFQESTTSQLDSLLNKSGLNADVIFVSLTPETPWNYSLKEASAIGNDAVEVTAAASGRKLVNGKIRLAMGNVGTVPVKLSIDENRTGSVVIPFSTQENKTCKVALDEKDPLLYDNVTYICSGQSKRSDILVLGDTDENFVISAAIKSLKQRASGRVMLKSCLDITAADIDGSPVVIVNHPSIPCPELERCLSTRNNTGVAIIYCLSEDSLDLISDYSLLKKRFPDIGIFKRSVVTTPVNPVLPDINSGLWYGFPERKLSQLSIVSYATALPGLPLCYLSDGGVLFSTTDDKMKTRWIFSAIPLGVSRGSDVWESAVFVPVLDRLLKLLDSRAPSDRIAIAGYPVKNPLFSKRERGYIYDSDGKPVVVPDRPEIVFQNPGVYKVVGSDAPVSFISVFPDSMESKMNFRAPNVRRTLYNNAIVCSAGEILSLSRRQSSGIVYYLPWIIIGLLILIEVLAWESVSNPNVVKKIRG